MQSNSKDIYFVESYVSREHTQEIKNYFDETVNDWFSNGPRTSDKWHQEWIGCFDRPLRLERQDNPLLPVIDKLKADFGNFDIFEASIRYMNYPFPPHSDVRDSETIMKQRKQHTAGHVFIIPLWWQKGYKPGTAFFNSPPKLNEPMYVEHQDIFPKAKSDKEVKEYSVKKIIKWKNPGDLVAWKNYQWHSTLTTPGYDYSRDEFCKEFVSIETWGKTNA